MINRVVGTFKNCQRKECNNNYRKHNKKKRKGEKKRKKTNKAQSIILYNFRNLS